MNALSFELLGAIVAGIGAGAMIFALMHASRKAGFALPKWLLPAGIGLAMIGYSVWNDYSWFSRAQEQLPAGAEMLLVGKDNYLWAPWTYVAPVIVRFAALDPARISDTGENIRRAEIMLIERRRPTVIVRQNFDCAKGMISVAGGDWQKADDDPAIAIVCSGEAG